MNSLAVQAAKKVSVQDARRLLKYSKGLPNNIRSILREKSKLPKDIHELAKMIRKRVYNRAGIEVEQKINLKHGYVVKYVPIQKITKSKSLQMARNLVQGKLSLNNRRLVSGRNTFYSNTPLNILLSSAPSRIKLNFSNKK